MHEEALCVLLQLGRLGHRQDEASWRALRCSSRALRCATEHALFAKLLPHQRLHFLRLNAALARHGTALDVSPMGRGKSYTAAAVAAASRTARSSDGGGGDRTVVWGPPSSELNWRQAFAHFQLGSAAEFYSYFRVQAQPAPYLDKRRDAAGRPCFAVRADWQRVGLLVLDEVHWLINRCQRSDALLQLVLALAPRGRVLCLSGTPLRHVEQTTQLARLLRIVRHPRLAQINLHTHQLELLGLRECFDFCERLDAAFRVPLPQHNGYYDESSVQVLHWCMTRVVAQHLFFAMPPPLRQHSAALSARRTYDLLWDAFLPHEQHAELQLGLVGLRDAAQLLRCSGRSGEALAALRQSLHRIELAKLPLFVQFAEHHLRRSAHCKVLLMVHAKATLEALRAALADWAPLCVSSRSTSLQRRNRLRAQFQAPSAQHRLLISTAGLLATGCDLDDQSARGDYPRVMAISPSSLADDVKLQVAARVDRLMTTSQASVYYLYSNLLEEHELMRRLTSSGGRALHGAALHQPARLTWSQLCQWS